MQQIAAFSQIYTDSTLLPSQDRYCQILPGKDLHQDSNVIKAERGTAGVSEAIANRWERGVEMLRDDSNERIWEMS